MNRVPYRRVTPPRNQAGRAAIEKSTSYESHTRYSQSNSNEQTEIPSQFPKIVISGLLLLAVVVVCTADFLIPLRSGLQDILSGASTIQELLEVVQNFGRSQLGFDYIPTLYEPPPAAVVPSLWE